MDVKELSNRFLYHVPAGDKPTRHAVLRREAYGLAVLIDKLCPDGREKSLAITKLEEALFWANAAVARYDELPPLPKTIE